MGKLSAGEGELEEFRVLPAAEPDRATRKKVQGGAVESARQVVVAMLMDNLLHEARNPLNALSINLEILAERLRRDRGLSPAQEKSIRTMREQIGRVDATMRRFADFLSPRPGSTEPVDVSAMVENALDVLGHEARRRRIQVKAAIGPGLRSPGEDSPALHALVMLSIARGLARSPGGGALEVTLTAEGREAALKVEDGGAGAPEPWPETTESLGVLSQRLRGSLTVHGSVLELRVPLL